MSATPVAGPTVDQWRAPGARSAPLAPRSPRLTRRNDTAGRTVGEAPRRVRPTVSPGSPFGLLSYPGTTDSDRRPDGSAQDRTTDDQHSR